MPSLDNIGSAWSAATSRSTRPVVPCSLLLVYCKAIGPRKTGVKATSLFTTLGKMHLCKLCRYATISYPSMVLHLQNHASKKPYQCPHCPRAFEHSRNFYCHSFTHRNQGTFNCLTCHCSCKTQYELLYHMRKHK
nr:zinc finger protein 555-like [Dermacentor andersoni]